MTDETLHNFSLYKISTGEVTSTKTLLNEAEMIETLAAINNPDRAYITGTFTPGEQYVKDGVVHDLPAPPTRWHVWDLASETWQDQRTEDDMIAALEAERAEMQCSPLQGMLVLGEERWLQVEAFLASPETPFAMRTSITSAVVWYRNSQTIDELAWLMGLTPEEVDDLFRLAATISV